MTDTANHPLNCFCTHCSRAHVGTLADRWQEIGRQQCEATHHEIRRSAVRLRDAVTDLRVRNATQTGLIRGRRQGAGFGLGVAFALAVVAGYLGRRRCA